MFKIYRCGVLCVLICLSLAGAVQAANSSWLFQSGGTNGCMRLPSACGHSCCKQACRCRCCQHATTFYADYMLLHASGADMAYGNPQDGLGGIGTVPVGAVGVADPSHESGFRVGGTWALDKCACFDVSYTWFDSSTQDEISVSAPNVINPLVLYPGTNNGGSAPLRASATYDIDFQLVDIDYKVRRFVCDSYGVNYVLGFRYGNLGQDFSALYPFGAPDGQTSLTTEIDFDGFGIKCGIEAERNIGNCWPVQVYFKGLGTVMSGQFNADYTQVDQFNGVEANVSWSDDRFVPIIESELGLAWTSCCGHWRVKAGYYYAAWLNVVTTPEWVQHVRQVDYTDISSSITFDGFVGRLEYHW